MEHRERGEFVKRGGRWYFTDGKVLGPKTIRSEGPKIGRNEPLPLRQRQEVQEMLRSRLVCHCPMYFS